MTEPKILHLTLKKKWFDMIASGEKKEEYREIKPYWVDRLLVPKDIGGSVWDEPGAYDEMLYDLQYPTPRHRNTDEVLEYFRVKPKQFDVVEFRNGYGRSAPTITVEWNKLLVGVGIEMWGGKLDYCFVIKLGKIISINNYQP